MKINWDKEKSTQDNLKPLSLHVETTNPKKEKKTSFLISEIWQQEENQDLEIKRERRKRSLMCIFKYKLRRPDVEDEREIIKARKKKHWHGLVIQ